MVSPGDTLDQCILEKSVHALFQSAPILAPVAERLTYQTAAGADIAHISHTIANRKLARTVLGDPLMDAAGLLWKPSRTQQATKNGDPTGGRRDNGKKSGFISPDSSHSRKIVKQKSVLKSLTVPTHNHFQDTMSSIYINVCPISVQITNRFGLKIAKLSGKAQRRDTTIGPAFDWLRPPNPV